VTDRPDLNDDQKRVLVYLYRCEQAGTRPKVEDMDIPRDRVLAALEYLASIGFIERT